MEEIGHVVVPRRVPSPGSVVHHGGVPREVDELETVAHFLQEDPPTANGVKIRKITKVRSAQSYACSHILEQP